MKLGLGTVQFGMDYGVSNAAGRVSEPAAREILDIAREAGIDTLDTAAGYGDAEAVLGRICADWPDARIVTKTCVLRDMAAGRAPADAVRETFEGSLERLGHDRVDTLMAHLADDLLGADGDAVWAAMAALKDAGLVRRIGSSCYTAAEAQALMARYPIEIIQLPMNAFDRRMAEAGVLEACRDEGIAVHVRSAFLQGLLLMDPARLPDGFSSARAPLTAFRGAADEAGLTPLAAALCAVSDAPGVERVIVGVTSAGELREILEAAEAAAGASLDADALAVDNEALITPSRWPPDSDEAWTFRYATTGEGA